MGNQKLGKNNGHTLLEVLGAVGLFAITIVALLTLIASTQSMGLRSQEAYNAFNLAKNRIEFLRTMSFDDLDDADEEEVRINASGVPDPDGRFLRSTTVTQPYQGQDELAQVDVEVAYEVQGVLSAPVEMTSVIENEEA